ASYKTTLNILKKYPLFGIGFGNYPFAHTTFRSQDADAKVATPDNMYLRFLCETGIIGTGVFFVFIGYWMYKIYKVAKNDSLIWAFFAGLISFLINLMAADLFLWLPLQISFWMVFGLCVSLADKKADIKRINN
ncbi:MAG: O-antigen ligase family protein, partial [Elusimicrobiota bacterium]